MADARAVSFDFGQTIARLDTVMLCRRLGSIGVTVDVSKIEAAEPEAFAVYDAVVRGGTSNHPWKPFMKALLELGGAAPHAVPAAVDWLWDQQPTQNLWRRPVDGMLELCADLRSAGVPFGILSNSEGHLAELVQEMGLSNLFSVLGDSGVLGMEKPDPRIFAWMAQELAVDASEVVHVGDSRGADVEGALRANMRALWFRLEDRPLEPEVEETARDLDPSRARLCRGAREVRAALAAWGMSA